MKGLRHCSGLRPQPTILRADQSRHTTQISREKLLGLRRADPGRLHPVLHHPVTVPRFHADIPKAGRDDTVGHIVERSSTSMERNCQVPFVLLVLQTPHREEAATGQYLLEELLGRRAQPAPARACGRTHSQESGCALSWRSGSLDVEGDFCK